MLIYNEYCSFKTAMLAKEKGFKEKCTCYFNSSLLINHGENPGCYEENSDGYITYKLLEFDLGVDFNTEEYEECNTDVVCSAPTLLTLDAWILDNYHLQITVFSQSQESWQYKITKPHESFESVETYEDFDSKYSAWDDALKTALLMV